MINDILKKNEFTRPDIVALLSLEKKEDVEALYDAAYREKLKYSGKIVYFRGLIEFSNICVKDCYYCGIRKSNKNVKRFFSTMDEILEAANFAYEQNYGSIVLQSGEREDDEFVKFVEKALLEIKKIGNGALGVTLSLTKLLPEHRYLSF
ncbi:MAG TPA: [FeFe] hydrogenase H-cluster radical SAM maturase HydE, partial [bacterium]|nr:[FeFe] hydrogenase H-cluster radical SAM maturase HydE [bacterium]